MSAEVRGAARVRKGKAMERLTYTVSETAETLGIGRTSLYAMIGDGRLIAIKIGRRTLIKVSSIKALIGDEPSETDG